MPAERFDIEIRDLVAKTIRTELKSIGAEARSTHDIVRQLNAEIASGARSAASAAQTAAAQTVQAANATAAAQAKAAAESARSATAQARLSTEQTRGALAAEKLATAQARTAEAQSRANIAYLNEEAALNRAIAAEGRATTSKERLAAATDKSAAAAQRELRITPGGVTPGSGDVIGSQAGSRSTVANAARIMNKTPPPSDVVPTVTPQQAREFEQFTRQVQSLKNELDPAAAAAAAFAAKSDLLNRGLEKGVLTAAEHKAATTALRKAEEEAAAATVRHGGAMVGMSGKVREMIVVMRELARGDMTRLPGSLSILAGQFGLLGSVSIGAIAGFAALAVGAGVVVAAMAAGEVESNKLANALSLSGNAAGLTSTSFDAMAHRIADSTKTSVGSNKELLLSIAGNAAFTQDEMGKLVTASQELGRATGQSADDVLSNFVKMADGPTKYAETFYNQYSGVITPTLVDHVRQLEATGQTYEATKVLVDAITEGLARNQVEQTGIIIRAWHAVGNAVSEAWDALKGIGAATSTAQDLAKVNEKIARLSSGQLSHRPLESMAELQAQQAFLQRRVAGEQMMAEATARTTREQRLQAQGVKELEGTYGHLIDSHARLDNDTRKLQNTLRNAVGWGSTNDPSVRFNEVIQKARTSSNAAVRNMANNYTTALDKLKKQDMPDLYRAEHKKTRTRKGPKPWDREKYLTEDETHLDEQIGALKDYGQALTEANMLESISRKYREHKQPLDDKEVATIRAKIHALEEGKRVQQAMTAADEAANGPTRAYEATVSALADMLHNGAINQAEMSRQMYLAEEAYKSATDPLYQMNKQLERNAELVGHFGKDLDVRSFIQQMDQAAKARGESIYKPVAFNDNRGPNGDIVVTGNRRPQLTDQAQGMVDEFRRQQQEKEHTTAFEAIDPRKKQDPSSPNYILDHYKAMYDAIQKFREQDVTNEAEANERKKNLDRAYASARLGTVSTMLEQIATLQTAHSRTVAAIGKAAAIAQATIDGYRAVQAALAGPPGPPWSFAIAAVAGTMAAVNVARIAGVGFQGGGYTGDGAVTDEAGKVHRREYVFDAAATSRIGVPALEALRSGSLGRAPSNDNRGVNVTVKPMPGVYVEERRTPDGDIEMIARRIVRSDAPRAVADDIRGNPNSHTSTAISSSYGVRRTR